MTLAMILFFPLGEMMLHLLSPEEIFMWDFLKNTYIYSADELICISTPPYKDKENGV